MNSTNFIVLAALAASCGLVVAQTPSAADQAATARKWQLGLNRNKLTVSVTLDRKVYFPGEDAQVTIRIANPTAQIMEVPEPFNTLTGCVGIKRPGTGIDQGEWVYAWSNCAGGEGFVVRPPEPPPPPAIWISPSQPLEKTFWLSELGCAKPGSSFVGACHLNEAEGVYRIVYDYDYGAYAQYQIVWPQLEQWTRVKLEKPGQVRDVANPTGKVLTFSRWAWLAAISYQGSHIIIAGRHDNIGGPLQPDPSGKFTGPVSRDFAPFRRIATSSAPIASLQAVADSSENIVLTHVDQTGKTVMVKLNVNRDVVP